VQTIGAVKFDDTPRLVFADWLDERGQPGDNPKGR
jgi:uncharacterized protein (TIGR02996 family)